jgi:hypothetical protein
MVPRRELLTIVGDIPELKNYVYQMGNHRAQYDKITNAIAKYCGRTLGKPMMDLVLGTDQLPEKPEPPATKKEDTDGWVALEYDKELNEWIKEKNLYKKDKAKVFIIVQGQCSTHMTNKLEGQKEYKELEDNVDVVGLVKMIRELIFNTRSVQYQHWTSSQIIRNIMTCRQGGNESLIGFYKRWKTILDVAESQWGAFVPTKLAAGADSDVERK